MLHRRRHVHPEHTGGLPTHLAHVHEGPNVKASDSRIAIGSSGPSRPPTPKIPPTPLTPLCAEPGTPAPEPEEPAPEGEDEAPSAE